MSMTMTMFGVKVEEGKEGKNGQPSICLVYQHPISKIGLLQLILICVQLGDSLGCSNWNLWSQFSLKWIVATEFHIGFCTVAAAAPPIFFKGKFLTQVVFIIC